MFGSSESWGPQQHPHPWHFRAGGGAVHSIKSGHFALQHHHSITSSANARSFSDTSSPSALAVLRLITSSTFVACSTGNSAGFSPLTFASGLGGNGLSAGPLVQFPKVVELIKECPVQLRS